MRKKQSQGLWRWLAWVSGLVFGALTLAVTVGWQPLMLSDTELLSFFTSYRPTILTNTALFLSLLGTLSSIATIGITAAILLVAGRHQLSRPFIISFSGALVSFYVIKFLIERARPAVEALTTAPLSSFPSGHASMGMALYGSLALLAAHHTRSSTVRRSIFLVAGILIMLIGWSRLYLGVHYPSDVLAGFLLGLFWIALGKLVELRVLRLPSLHA